MIYLQIVFGTSIPHDLSAVVAESGQTDYRSSSARRIYKCQIHRILDPVVKNKPQVQLHQILRPRHNRKIQMVMM